MAQGSEIASATAQSQAGAERSSPGLGASFLGGMARAAEYAAAGGSQILNTLGLSRSEEPGTHSPRQVGMQELGGLALAPFTPFPLMQSLYELGRRFCSNPGVVAEAFAHVLSSSQDPHHSSEVHAKLERFGNPALVGAYDKMVEALSNNDPRGAELAWRELGALLEVMPPDRRRELFEVLRECCKCLGQKELADRIGGYLKNLEEALAAAGKKPQPVPSRAPFAQFEQGRSSVDNRDKPAAALSQAGAHAGWRFWRFWLLDNSTPSDWAKQLTDVCEAMGAAAGRHAELEARQAHELEGELLRHQVQETAEHVSGNVGDRAAGTNAMHRFLAEADGRDVFDAPFQQSASGLLADVREELAQESPGSSFDAALREDSSVQTEAAPSLPAAKQAGERLSSRAAKKNGDTAASRSLAHLAA